MNAVHTVHHRLCLICTAASTYLVRQINDLPHRLFALLVTLVTAGQRLLLMAAGFLPDDWLRLVFSVAAVRRRQTVDPGVPGTPARLARPAGACYPLRRPCRSPSSICRREIRALYADDFRLFDRRYCTARKKGMFITLDRYGCLHLTTTLLYTRSLAICQLAESVKLIRCPLWRSPCYY